MKCGIGPACDFGDHNLQKYSRLSALSVLDPHPDGGDGYSSESLMLPTKVLSLFASRNVVYVLVVEVGFVRKVPLAWSVPAAHKVCRAFMCSSRIAERFSLGGEFGSTRAFQGARLSISFFGRNENRQFSSDFQNLFRMREGGREG